MKKLSVLICALCLLSGSIFAEGWDAALYKKIEQSIKAPTFSEKVYKPSISVKAKAAKNQKAIQAAIDKCSAKGGGKVVIPAGTFWTGAITLKSDVNLVLSKGAVLKFAFEPELYPKVYTRYEGLDLYGYSPCIYSNGAKNIAITGEGTIDGNGNKNTFWMWTGEEWWGYKGGETSRSMNGVMGSRELLQKMCDEGVPVEQRQFGMGKGLRMQLVNLVNSENILIEGVTMIDSPFWVLHPLFSKNITIRGIKVINEGPNGDGCDPESCENVLIENCMFHTGDDCIAIKSGRNADGRRDGRPSKNIIIRGCTMEDGHGGVVIGSEISAGVENVFAENCNMSSPNLDRILRIKTNTCRGGVTKNIYMRNVTVGECKESVMRININYWPKEVSERGHIPYVHNVWMENVTCQKSKYGVQINGIKEKDAVYDIHVKNCTFNNVSVKPFLRENRCHDIFFDNVKVNGKLMNTSGSDFIEKAPYKSYAEWMTYSEMKRNPNPIYLDFTDSIKHPKGKWSYVMGIELEGMLDTYYAHGGEAIKNYVMRYPAQMISDEGKTTGFKYEDFNLDNVRTAHFIFRVDSLAPRAGVKLALKEYFRQLINQPRTDEGVYWHKQIYHDQVWLDGIFMGLPYKTMAAPYMVKEGLTVANKGVAPAGKKKMNKKIAAAQQKELMAFYDDIVDQITMTDARTYDAKTGLWKHAWDSKRGMFWADKTTGQSRHTWARAMGWFTMAQIEILDYLPKDYARRQEVIDMLNKTLRACINYQDPKTGVWYDVMDVKDPRNYIESTASCMFTYCLLKGARLGYLDDSFRQAGIKAYKGIINNFIRVDVPKDGSTPTISLTEGVSVSGLGPEKNPRRDGTFDYYMSEPIRDNDAKGVGPFLWATLEMEKLGYNTSSQY